jgi:hypothetical protein
MRLEQNTIKVSTIYHWFMSLWTYSDLRPDWAVRRQVNRRILGGRPDRSFGEWYQRFWEPEGVSREVADFIYRHIPRYSGLRFAQVLPSDRLCEDLKLPLVCWFDWELSLYEDLQQKLGIDLGEDYFDVTQFATVADLVGFVNQKFAQ